jgi:ABC-type transport system involved in multi-copper enzyme maturation permease subunit
VTGRDSFVQLVHAEWTKFRTVRGWIVGVVVAALVTVLLGLLTRVGSHTSCGDDPQDEQACEAPVGPSGDQVNDNFYFVHQPLRGDGSITVQVTSLTGRIPSGHPGPDEMRSGLVPWAKAGLIVKDGTALGSTYAAVMVTGDHGVRMQHDYVHDTAGPSGSISDDSPRWLRLTRSGDVVTGETSTDGTNWSTVGTARLDGLGSTVEAGLFVTSPAYTEIDQRPFALAESGGPSQATGVFDRVDLGGSWPEDAWSGDNLGDGSPLTASLVGYDQSGDTFTVRGTGDIAPAIGGRASQSIEQTLAGTFAGLIAVIVVGAMFITAEYRRGLIHTTFAACPRRGRVLGAKVLVLGAVTFTVGLAASIVAVTWGERRPVTTAMEVRVVVGTAALFAVAAVLALALGTVLRRSAGAVTAVITVMILPYILATASVLPTGPSQWLLRLTPAAAFSVQQSLREYPQVDNLYAPANGYFPLEPWAGFAVLCAYTAAALALAVVLLRRRDA